MLLMLHLHGLYKVYRVPGHVRRLHHRPGSHGDRIIPSPGLRKVVHRGCNPLYVVICQLGRRSQPPALNEALAGVCLGLDVRPGARQRLRALSPHALALASEQLCRSRSDHGLRCCRLRAIATLAASQESGRPRVASPKNVWRNRVWSRRGP
jgi:hypothetical protein